MRLGIHRSIINGREETGIFNALERALIAALHSPPTQWTPQEPKKKDTLNFDRVPNYSKVGGVRLLLSFNASRRTELANHEREGWISISITTLSLLSPLV